MLRALEAGLTLRDFEHLTAGMIFDFIITASNDRSDDDGARKATQEDYDRF